MSWGQTLSRAGWHTAAGALVNVGVGIAVNLATSGTYSSWVWIAVGALTLGVFGTSLWAQHNQGPATSPPATGVELGNVKARSFRAKNVKSPGTALRIRRGRFAEDMTVEDIEAGRGDASHP